MAHTCPECGQTCYCRGDCDDVIIDGSSAEMLCEHCDGDFGDDDFGEEDNFHDDFEDVDSALYTDDPKLLNGERRKGGEG